MKFQKTTEYAIRVMVYLAKHKNKRLSAKKIHLELDIPYKYLSRLMGKLSEAGYIDVLAGRWGGYKIIKDIHTIY
jgi:Rrf2 family protein